MPPKTGYRDMECIRFSCEVPSSERVAASQTFIWFNLGRVMSIELSLRRHTRIEARKEEFEAYHIGCGTTRDPTQNGR